MAKITRQRNVRLKSDPVGSLRRHQVAQAGDGRVAAVSGNKKAGLVLAALAANCPDGVSREAEHGCAFPDLRACRLGATEEDLIEKTAPD